MYFESVPLLTEEDLREVFGKVGAIVFLKLFHDVLGRSMGKGVCEFESELAARKAIRTLDGCQLVSRGRPRPMRVYSASPATDLSPGDCHAPPQARRRRVRRRPSMEQAPPYKILDLVEYLSTTHQVWLNAQVLNVNKSGGIIISLKPNTWIARDEQATKIRPRAGFATATTGDVEKMGENAAPALGHKRLCQTQAAVEVGEGSAAPDPSITERNWPVTGWIQSAKWQSGSAALGSDATRSDKAELELGPRSQKRASVEPGAPEPGELSPPGSGASVPALESLDAQCHVPEEPTRPRASPSDRPLEDHIVHVRLTLGSRSKNVRHAAGTTIGRLKQQYEEMRQCHLVAKDESGFEIGNEVMLGTLSTQHKDGTVPLHLEEDIW